ncbi:MAG TPA: PAS domain-containing protein, partial [Candidatus Binatia bacterium]|nr:PAS domain-containing protein [Candidatus Binatia bacterium]
PTQRERLLAEYESRSVVRGVELTWKKKNGEHLVVRLYGRMLHDTQGCAIGYEGIVLDVTERKKAEQEREILSQFAHDLARSSDIPTMANHIFTLTKNLLGSDYGFLLLVNAEGTELRGVAAHGIDSEKFRQEQVVVATELTAVTVAFQRKEPVMILDRQRSPQVSPRLQEKYRFVRSAWIVPLMSGEKAVGTLSVGYAARREATPAELRLLQLLGDEAALALERVRLTEELSKSEARYRTISELVSDYAYAIRIEPDYTTYTLEWVTEAFTRIVGFTPGKEPYSAESWEPFIYPEDLPVARERLRRLMSGQADTSEFRIISRNREVRWVREYGRPVWDEAQGRVRRLYIAGRDITDRKRTEEALQRSEERYRSLTFATAQIVWTADPQGQAADDMPMWRIFTGQSVEAVKGLGWFDALHPEDHQRVLDDWLKAVSARNVYTTVFRLRRSDGEYRYLGVRGVPVLEQDGQVREWMGACSDITERKQAEEALRESQHFIKRVADTIPSILYVYDMVEQHHIYMNRQIADMLGYTLEEIRNLKGAAFHSLVHPDDQALFITAYTDRSAVTNENGIFEIEYRVKHANGEWRWLHCRETVFNRNANGVPQQILGAAQDITERKRLEELVQERIIQPQDVAGNLKKFRKSLNLSQKEFGQTFGGYSLRQINAYENGESEVPLRLLLAITNKGYPLSAVLGSGSTDALDKVVGYLAASRKAYLQIQELAGRLTQSLDQENKTINSILHDLGFMQREPTRKRRGPADLAAKC